MEPAKTEFDLNLVKAAWQSELQSRALTPDDVIELMQHLDDHIATLTQRGFTYEEAWLVANHRFGRPEVVADEFLKVNPGFAASRNWLMLFWGATIFMVMQTLSFVLPNILAFIVVPQGMFRHGARLIDAGQAETIMYSAAIFFAALAIINLIWGNKLAGWFIRFLQKYGNVATILLLIVGSFAAFFNYASFGEIVEHTFSIGGYNNISDASQRLGEALYLPLIGFTAYYTIRYNKPELFDVKTFARNIVWQRALAIGALFELTGVMCRAANFWISDVVTLTLFFIGGCLIVPSKHRRSNIAILL